MNMNSITHNVLFQMIAFAVMSVMIFAATEGVVATAQTTDEFIITQDINGEISFATTANDVTMSTPIGALTGGSSTGSTQVAVTTNEPAGYSMDIRFEDDSAMQRDGGGGEIADYTPVGTSDYAFSTSTASGEFGYSVSADTPADAVAAFQDDGSSSCGSGGSSTVGACWVAPTTTDYEIINRSSATGPTGATTTLSFQVYIPPNPSPTIPTGSYTATATLTITTNP